MHKHPRTDEGCVFRTKYDFQFTGRAHDTGGQYLRVGQRLNGTICFQMSSSEYADDCAVAFAGRWDCAHYIPIIFDHFAMFGMEVHTGPMKICW